MAVMAPKVHGAHAVLEDGMGAEDAFLEPVSFSSLTGMGHGLLVASISRPPDPSAKTGACTTTSPELKPGIIACAEPELSLSVFGSHFG
jgi:hypothetical protein